TEVVLDDVGPVAEAQDEVLVSEVGVVLHDVPEDRAIADRHHRLRDVLVVIPKPRPQTTTEEHNLHSFPFGASPRAFDPRCKRRAPSGDCLTHSLTCGCATRTSIRSAR